MRVITCEISEDSISWKVVDVAAQRPVEYKGAEFAPPPRLTEEEARAFPDKKGWKDGTELVIKDAVYQPAHMSMGSDVPTIVEDDKDGSYRG